VAVSIRESGYVGFYVDLLHCYCTVGTLIDAGITLRSWGATPLEDCLLLSWVGLYSVGVDGRLLSVSLFVLLPSADIQHSNLYKQGAASNC